MDCNSCLVRELSYEIKVEGNQNLPIMREVGGFLSKRNRLVEGIEDIYRLKESAARDFLDFCKDHMNPEEIFFRLNGNQWQPILEMDQIMDMQWIDEVITRELLTCYYQPIVNAEIEVYAYELLSRFIREDGSLIYPSDIFKAAKKRGRLYALDRLCRMTAVRYAVPLEKKAFINFIPTSIYSPEHCLQSTIQLANQLGAEPSQFVFEVVETEKVDDLDHLKSILAFYREKGFQYALDDVGEGYSTIEMLSDLKPKYMKLDMKYVQGVAADSQKQQTAQTFLEKALEIGSIPLAEGVETKEDFEWLKERGYQLFQGYLFGKPSPEPLSREKISLLPSSLSL